MAELTTAQDAEVAGLRLQLATVQSELREARPLVEQKTIDVSTMHSYSARHADCLRSLSRALQSVAEGLRGLSRMQSREGQPAKVREACEEEPSEVAGDPAPRARKWCVCPRRRIS